MKSALIALAMLPPPITTVAADFSPEEILGSYVSTDSKAKVTVRKILVSDATLFDPAQYSYRADIEVDAGPCMEMYGNDTRIVRFNDTRLYYNGTWKPTEYLMARTGSSTDYDGSVYVSAVSFSATKKSAAHDQATYSLELAIDVSHNPDVADGGDGGQSEFRQCIQKTVTSWQLNKAP